MYKHTHKRTHRGAFQVVNHWPSRGKDTEAPRQKKKGVRSRCREYGFMACGQILKATQEEREGQDGREKAQSSSLNGFLKNCAKCSISSNHDTYSTARSGGSQEKEKIEMCNHLSQPLLYCLWQRCWSEFKSFHDTAAAQLSVSVPPSQNT